MYMFNNLYLIHAISHTCDQKSFITHPCDTMYMTVQYSTSELLFFASLRLFECDCHQYADVQIKNSTTENAD